MPAISRERARTGGGDATRRAIVERAEAYVRANWSTPIPVARLSRVTGVSERGLRNAFYGVHGMGPKRWMLAARLTGAQLALRKRRDVALTVTGVATTYGFFQLGRFSAIYKQTFGEAPSKTLQSASLEARSSTTEHRGERSNVVFS